MALSRLQVEKFRKIGQRAQKTPTWEGDLVTSAISTPDSEPQPTPEDEDVELVVVTMAFDAADPLTLAAVLSKYVVMTRREDGCRNVDLCIGFGNSSRFVVLQKWSSPAAQQAHFDGEVMLNMAQSCNGILTKAPQIELLEGISAHDLA